MYLQHFGLREFPFSLTPDTGFFFQYGAHQEALNVLLVALRTGEGFIKVTGEVGTGKTLLCRLLLNGIGEDFVTAYLPNPSLTPTALRMALAEELGIDFARNIGQHRLLRLITDHLLALNGAGKQVVLLIDEAQALPQDSLEALRLLTNLETEKTKLLQVVLFGQPELDERLAQAGLRQLRQRITFAYTLGPIDRQGLEGYVRHRLQRAGHQGAPLFAPRALTALHKASRGIPRLINILAHKALLAAYGRGSLSVGRTHVRAATHDTEDSRPRHLLARLRPMLIGSLGMSGMLGFGIYLWLGVVA